jgi:hypothetical protein
MASSYKDADNQLVFVLASYTAKNVPTSDRGQEILHNILIILINIFFFEEFAIRKKAGAI